MEDLSTVGFIGGGQMARALAAGFVHARLLSPDKIVVHDPVPAAVDQFCELVGEVKVAASNEEVVENSNVVFLAVKPQYVDAVASALPPDVFRNRLLISIVAGVTLDRLKAAFGTERMIRVMPNTPCLIGAGASAFARGGGATEGDGELVGRLMQAVGTAMEVEEGLLDAVTGLSGSGPAFVYTMIEALSDGGVSVGLPRSTATALAAQTVRGAAEMVLRTGEHTGVLKDRVASPGGTTIAGLRALEDHGLRAALMAAVAAATTRSKELSS